jgi:hypothetical protein
MEFVVAQLIEHIKRNKQTHGNTYGEPKHIDKRIKPVTQNIPESNFKVILKDERLHMTASLLRKVVNPTWLFQ